MDKIELSDLQKLVLETFPYPIAVNYLRIINETSLQEKTHQAIRVYEFSLRALVLALISQYLLDDREKVSESKLNRLLKEKLPKPSLGSWVEIFFAIVQAYKNHPDILFMTELFDVFWDKKNGELRKGVRKPFQELVNIRNKLAHGLPPRDEEGWETQFELTHRYLLQIFDLFKFISNYELIFIISHVGGKYYYSRYRGQQIVTESEPLLFGKDANLGEGWFYLAKEQFSKRRLLKLYPFLIAWDKDIGLSDPDMQSDAALLDKFSHSRIYYVATVLWESFFRQDDDLLADFFYNFERALQDKRRGDRLSWNLLKEIAKQITEMNIEDMIRKYNPDLYVNREELHGIYKDFLISDKTGLVVTGKSGVGKSNFIMATIESHRDDPGVCTIVYNGARLPIDISLTELLKSGIEMSLDYTDSIRGRRDAWGIISEIPDIVHKLVIIFIDAINENTHASEVLRRLDLVIGSNPFPWLKIVITSRPETWRVMIQRLRLAYHKYYWLPYEDEMGVELQEFHQEDPASTTVQVDNLTRSEAQTAYEKYKNQFGLLTEYSDLSGVLRGALQDPFMLRLVAEIHRDKTISTIYRTDQIYADYINALISSKRLYPEDIIFLQGEIVPRMAHNLANTIEENELMEDRYLYESIFNSDILPSGVQVNQSFINLVDAEILTSFPQVGEITISFKYERFFDIFLGEYYYRQIHGKLDAFSRYEELSALIRTHPFLWGAIKSSLVRELISGHDELLYKLAFQPDQVMKELITAAMTEYGMGNDEQSVVYDLIKRLLNTQKGDNKLLERLNIYLPRNSSEERLDPKMRSASMIALEVARRLNLVGILEMASKHSSRTVRVIAMRNIYHFWRSNPIAGFQFLNSLAQQITSRLGFPHVPILESCIGVSMLIMRHYHPNTVDGRELGIELLRMWQGIIRRLLFISDQETIGRKVLRNAIRNSLIQLIVRFIVLTQENYPPSRPSFLRDVGYFFKSSSKVTQRFKRLVNFFNSPRGIEEIIGDLFEAIPENDVFTCFLIWLILITNGRQNPDKISLIIEKLSDYALKQPVMGVYPHNLNIALGHIALSKSLIDDVIYELHERMVKNYLEITHGFFYSQIGTKHNNLTLGEHGLMRRARNNPNDTDLLKTFLRIAVENEDWEFVDALLFDVTIQATAFQNPRGTFDALEELFPIHNNRLNDSISSVLAKVNIHYPEMVNDFLYDVDPTGELYQRISNIEPSEQPWFDLIQAPSGTILLRLIETSEIRSVFGWILTQATDCKKLDEYMVIVLKKIINLMSESNT